MKFKVTPSIIKEISSAVFSHVKESIPDLIRIILPLSYNEEMGFYIDGEDDNIHIEEVDNRSIIFFITVGKEEDLSDYYDEDTDKIIFENNDFYLIMEQEIDAW